MTSTAAVLRSGEAVGEELGARGQRRGAVSRPGRDRLSEAADLDQSKLLSGSQRLSLLRGQPAQVAGRINQLQSLLPWLIAAVQARREP